MAQSPYRVVLDAIAFAARVHDGQMRKDGRTPYISHIFRVTAVLRNVFGFDDPRMLATALLHDTIEDTKTDFDDLAEQFGPQIAEWAGLLSKDKRLPDEKREQLYIQGLLNAPWQVQVCKLADVYDNLLDASSLPVEKRQKVYDRADSYLQAFKGKMAKEAQPAFAAVQELRQQIT